MSSEAASRPGVLNVGALIVEKFKVQGFSGVFSGVARSCGVALTFWQHRALVMEIERAGTRAVLDAFPRVQYRYTLPYLSSSLNWTERRGALQSHYAFVNGAFGDNFTKRVLGDAVEIWRAEGDGANLSISMQGPCAKTRHREGELTLAFKMDGGVIYKLSFSIVDARAIKRAELIGGASSGQVIFVGRVQGVLGALGAIRNATVQLGDIAPQDMLMSALQGVAGAIGARAVIGVDDETCVSREAIIKSGSSFSYADFWSKYGAQVVAGGHAMVPLPVVEKPITAIPAKHRKRTLRKRETKRSVVSQVEMAMRALMV